MAAAKTSPVPFLEESEKWEGVHRTRLTFARFAAAVDAASAVVDVCLGRRRYHLLYGQTEK